jgi:hypothetical protein
VQDSSPDPTTADEAYEHAASTEMDQDIVRGDVPDLLTEQLRARTGTPLSDMRQRLDEPPSFDGHALAPSSNVGQRGDAALAGLVRQLSGERVRAEDRRAVARVECQGC